MPYEEIKIEYSEEWKGPVKERSCTDLPFIAIFGMFMALWAAVGIYALSAGDIHSLVAPIDSQGRKCGVDNDVENAPNLIFFDLNECIENTCYTPQVCREKCPTSNWYFDIAWDETPVEEIRKNMICETGIDVTTLEKSQLRDLIFANKCAKWYLKSSSILGRCIPDSVPPELINVTITDYKLEEVREVIDGLAGTKTILHVVISTRGTVLGLIAGAAVISLIHIFLLRWIAFPFVLFSVAVLCVLLSCLSYIFYGRYKSENNAMWLTWAILSVIFAGLLLLVVLCLLKKIRLACQLLKESSRAVVDIFSTMIFPILPWLLHLGAIVNFIVIGLKLFSIKTLAGWAFGLLMTINFISFLWFYCFVTALGEMILASTFATWYWTFNKLQVPEFTIFVSAQRTIRYHLGTVAFGSVLITICHVLRTILEVLKQSARGRGLFLCLVAYCALIFVNLLEKFLNFMNRNAYIVCAVHGKGLCVSASTAMGLIFRNIVNVIVLNNAVSWILWLSKFMITMSMGLLARLYYTDTKYDTELVWIPITFVLIGTYLVTSIFLSVYVIAVDTIFLCFLEDCERHDGSPLRPYYMSRQLRSLLHKDAE